MSTPPDYPRPDIPQHREPRAHGRNAIPRIMDAPAVDPAIARALEGVQPSLADRPEERGTDGPASGAKPVSVTPGEAQRPIAPGDILFQPGSAADAVQAKSDTPAASPGPDTPDPQALETPQNAPRWPGIRSPREDSFAVPDQNSEEGVLELRIEDPAPALAVPTGLKVPTRQSTAITERPDGSTLIPAIMEKRGRVEPNTSLLRPLEPGRLDRTPNPDLVTPDATEGIQVTQDFLPPGIEPGSEEHMKHVASTLGEVLPAFYQADEPFTTINIIDQTKGNEFIVLSGEVGVSSPDEKDGTRTTLLVPGSSGRAVTKEDVNSRLNREFKAWATLRFTMGRREGKGDVTLTDAVIKGGEKCAVVKRFVPLDPEVIEQVKAHAAVEGADAARFIAGGNQNRFPEKAAAVQAHQEALTEADSALTEGMFSLDVAIGVPLGQTEEETRARLRRSATAVATAYRADLPFKLEPLTEQGTRRLIESKTVNEALAINAPGDSLVPTRAIAEGIEIGPWDSEGGMEFKEENAFDVINPNDSKEGIRFQIGEILRRNWKKGTPFYLRLEDLRYITELVGSPGTGKSETISTILESAVGVGIRLLFLANAKGDDFYPLAARFEENYYNAHPEIKALWDEVREAWTNSPEHHDLPFPKRGDPDFEIIKEKWDSAHPERPFPTEGPPLLHVINPRTDSVGIDVFTPTRGETPSERFDKLTTIIASGFTEDPIGRELLRIVSGAAFYGIPGDVQSNPDKQMVGAANASEYPHGKGRPIDWSLYYGKLMEALDKVEDTFDAEQQQRYDPYMPALRRYVKSHVLPFLTGELANFFNSRHNIEPEMIVDSNVLINNDGIPDELQNVLNQLFIMTLAGAKKGKYDQQALEHDDSKLTIVVIDEAWKVFPRSNGDDPSSATGMLRDLSRLGRAQAIAIMFATQLHGDVNKGMTEIARNRIVLGTDSEEARDELGKQMNATEPQKRQMANPPTGTGAAKLRGMEHGVMVAFNDPRGKTENKSKVQGPEKLTGEPRVPTRIESAFLKEWLDRDPQARTLKGWAALTAVLMARGLGPKTNPLTGEQNPWNIAIPETVLEYFRGSHSDFVQDALTEVVQLGVDERDHFILNNVTNGEPTIKIKIQGENGEERVIPNPAYMPDTRLGMLAKVYQLLHNEIYHDEETMRREFQEQGREIIPIPQLPSVRGNLTMRQYAYTDALLVLMYKLEELPNRVTAESTLQDFIAQGHLSLETLLSIKDENLQKQLKGLTGEKLAEWVKTHPEDENLQKWLTGLKGAELRDWLRGHMEQQKININHLKGLGFLPTETPVHLKAIELQDWLLNYQRDQMLETAKKDERSSQGFFLFGESANGLLEQAIGHRWYDPEAPDALLKLINQVIGPVTLTVDERGKRRFRGDPRAIILASEYFEFMERKTREKDRTNLENIRHHLEQSRRFSPDGWILPHEERFQWRKRLPGMEGETSQEIYDWVMRRIRALDEAENPSQNKPEEKGLAASGSKAKAPEGSGDSAREAREALLKFAGKPGSPTFWGIQAAFMHEESEQLIEKARLAEQKGDAKAAHALGEKAVLLASEADALNANTTEHPVMEPLIAQYEQSLFQGQPAPADELEAVERRLAAINAMQGDLGLVEISGGGK